jgi:hypothetical protein
VRQDFSYLMGTLSRALSSECLLTCDSNKHTTPPLTAKVHYFPADDSHHTPSGSLESWKLETPTTSPPSLPALTARISQPIPPTPTSRIIRSDNTKITRLVSYNLRPPLSIPRRPVLKSLTRTFAKVFTRSAYRWGPRKPSMGDPVRG